MDPDRETLNAFVDGELPPQEMERIARLLEQRPDLDRIVREQERLRVELREAYPSDAPVPEALIRTVQTAPISLRWRLRQWFGSPLRVLVPAGAALAVGLAIGLMVRPAADYGTDDAGRLVAQGSLAETLTTELASNGYRGSGARIGISFRSKAGLDCRTFSTGSDSGLACRDSGAWVVQTLVKQMDDHPGAAYRMAGSDMPEAVRRAVADSIQGTAFDAAAERRARDRGWSDR